jgi:hypothetical protein
MEQEYKIQKTNNMKKKLLFAAILFGTMTTSPCLGQGQIPEGLTTERPKRTAINVGVLMGGGSLLGADFEFLVGQRVGLQLGAGLSSVGAGVNIHLKPYINSPFISIAYWNQGFGDNHYASYVGPMYVYRFRKIFQAGIGLGAITSKGPQWKANNTGDKDVSAILLYNIGVYFPL